MFNTKIYSHLILAQLCHPLSKVEYIEMANGHVVKKIQLPFRKF